MEHKSCVGLRAALIGVGLFAACGAASAQNVVKIGQLDAQTGPFATYGFMVTRGAALAVHEINKAGGFKVGDKTYTFDLIQPDTRGDPKEGVIQAKRLLESEQVKFVFGPTTSNVFATVLPYAKRMDGKFLLLTSSTRAHAVVGQPGYGFLIRTWNWLDGPYGTATLLTKYVREKLKPKKIAVLMPNEEGGRATYDVLEKVFKEQGVDFVTEFYDPTTKDFTPLLGKLAAQGADLLAIPPGSYEAADTDIVRQASEGNYFKRFVPYNGGLQAPGMKNKDLIEDYVFDSPKDFEQAEKTEPKVKKFIESYKALFKEDFPYSQAPTCVSACYDTVYMLVQAMQKVGSVDDVAAIKKALITTPYQGLWNYRFDEKGEEMFDFDIVHITHGGAVQTERVKVGD